MTTSSLGSADGSIAGRLRPRRASACGAPRAAALHRTRTRCMVITAHLDAPGSRRANRYPDLPLIGHYGRDRPCLPLRPVMQGRIVGDVATNSCGLLHRGACELRTPPGAAMDEDRG